MPVNIIDTLKPKNGGSFPIVEAIDVFVENYGNLAEAVNHFATDIMIEAINTVLSGKANTSDVNTAVANLQNQINQIEISASAEAVVAPEVAAARVDEYGTSYQTLKARLDADQTEVANVGLPQNILPKEYASGADYTNNGIHFVVQNDGSVYSSGTATGEARYYWLNNANIKAGTYTISGVPADLTSSTFEYQILVDGVSMGYFTDTHTFTIADDSVISIRTIYFTNFVDTGHYWKMMLERGDRAHDYNPPKESIKIIRSDLDSCTSHIAQSEADIINLNAELDESDSRITNIENLTPKEPYGTFINDSLNTDGKPYGSGHENRICNSDFVDDYQVGDVLRIAEGFRILIYYYSTNVGNPTQKANSGWTTGSYTIENYPQYPYTKLLIARVTESSSEVANIIEFKSKVSVGDTPLIIETVNENTESIEDHEERITALESGVSGFLPDYWNTYLETKYPAITDAKASVGNHGDYFAFFTDYHAPLNKRYTGLILEAIKNNSDIGMYICGGDILTNHTKAVAIETLADFQKDFEKVGLINLYGNHDSNTYASDASDKLNNYEFYPFMFKDNERKSEIYMEKQGYFYIDNSTQKIRYIFINSRYSPTQFSIDLTQASWIIDKLSTLPSNDWGVVVITHEMYGTVNQDYSLTLDSTGTRIKELCDGFNTKTSGTSVGVEPVYNVDYDFTNAKGYMIGIVCGHAHNDFSEDSSAGYPIIACVCDAYQGSNQNPAYPRTAGTYLEQAIDLFFIDTTAKTIETIRIGSGSNRSFSYGGE